MIQLNIDEDLILPIATAFLAIAITILHTQCMFVSTHEAIIQELVVSEAEAFQDAASANREVDTLTKQLDYYHVTEASLVKLGASQQQARDVIKAAEVYRLDPKY
jgi:hypothetical protein